jgi:GH24 family phage-related lysozyme (muramidase)
MLSDNEKKSLMEMLRKGEGVIDYLYQDSVGKVTTGVGNLIPNAERLTHLEFLNQDGTRRPQVPSATVN